MAKVSIIIPVYNVEKYIEKCIESIINQTYKDVEIICVNDGSTDNSLTILENYASKDYRIKIINQDNKGVGFARNVGIDNSKGDLITFIDPDDFFNSDNILEKLVTSLVDNNVDAVIGKAFLFDNISKKKIGTRGWDNSRLLSNNKYLTKELSDKLFQYVYSSSCAKLYKNDIITKYHIRFPKIKMQEDLVFVFSYLANTNSIMFLSDPVIAYRVNRKGSATTVHKKNRQTWVDVFIAFDILKYRLRKYSHFDTYSNTFYQSFIYSCLGNIKNVGICEKIKLINYVRKKHSYLKNMCNRENRLNLLFKFICWGIV